MPEAQRRDRDVRARVRAGFILKGTSLTEWCRENGVDQGWASNILKASPRGTRARTLRRRMMMDSGPTPSRSRLRLMRERWLDADAFAEAVGIASRRARRALSRALEGHTWRGHVLEVRTVHGRGGRAGLSYEVALRSLSAALPAPPTVPPKEPTPLPSRAIVSTRSPAAERRWRMIEPVIDAAPEPEPKERRATAVAAVLAGPNPPAASTLRRTLALYDKHGGAGLADAKRCNAGKARVVVSRAFDQAYRTAGHPDAKLRKIGAELEQLRKNIWASPVRRAGNYEVRRRLQHELGKLCDRFSTPVPEAAQRLSRRWVEVDKAWSEIDVFKHDAKRFHDNAPHIIRDNLAGRPMDRVVADVKHLDVVLTRPDGSEVWPKAVGFLDQATGRVFLHLVMLGLGEGVRQEHVIEGFSPWSRRGASRRASTWTTAQSSHASSASATTSRW